MIRPNLSHKDYQRILESRIPDESTFNAARRLGYSEREIFRARRLHSRKQKPIPQSSP